MEISLEKIELVKDRTGVSYKEAKEALEKTDGNVVDAIIMIEDAIDSTEDAVSADKDAILRKIKEIIKKGNVTKIVFKKNGQVVLNIPVTVGVVGGVVFPWALLTGSAAALLTKCSIEIQKDDGQIIDLNEASGGRIDLYRDKAGDALINLGGKASDAFEDLRVKAGDAYENMKYKMDEYKERKAAEKEEEEDCFQFDEQGECDCGCSCGWEGDEQDPSEEEDFTRDAQPSDEADEWKEDKKHKS